jgi:hypothetical protein
MLKHRVTKRISETKGRKKHTSGSLARQAVFAEQRLHANYTFFPPIIAVTSA